MFRVGQKVVCVDVSAHGGRVPHELTLNSIYTIAGFNDEVGDNGVIIGELRHLGYEETDKYTFIPAYLPSRFRPIVARKTSIAVFEAMLKKVPATAEPRQTPVPAHGGGVS